MDDAEALLQQAQQQMQEAQARNRERAVQVITQKNHLQALVSQTQRTIDRLEEQAQTAEQGGNTDGARHFLAERDKYVETLTRAQASLEAAITTTEAVKTAMRREEQRIRTEIARALAMRTQHKQAQIEFAIEKSRLDTTTTTATELFERAQAKIRQTQARRDLVAQIRETVEALEASAAEALRHGDQDASKRLLSEGDKLREKALNPHLW